ncbi:MAG: NAD(P)H-binding protein [Candidatus Dormiibacterota bacterium]
MELTIIAATGGVGHLILEQAVESGHHVTAVARHPERLDRRARAVQVDLLHPDTAALRSAIEGADAVVSALGPQNAGDAGITWRGTQSIVDAMLATGTRRIVVISAAPVATTPSPGRPNPPNHDPGDGFFTRHLAMPIIKRVLGKVYMDLAQMEDILRESDLEWTALRPPRLTNKPRTGTYRTAHGQNVRRGLTISRADLADAMLRAIGDAESFKTTVGVAY